MCVCVCQCSVGVVDRVREGGAALEVEGGGGKDGKRLVELALAHPSVRTGHVS